MSAFSILAAATNATPRGALSAHPDTAAAGEPWHFTSPAWNYDAENPIDFSDPALVADVQVVDSDGATVLASPTQITFSGFADGTFALTANRTVTSALKPGAYAWSCRVSDGADTVAFWLASDSPLTVTPAQTLSADPAQITPTGTSLVTYTDTRDTAPAQVTFTVNGATSTVALTNGVAELEVTPGGAGDIAVTVDQDVPGVTITVQEA